MRLITTETLWQMKAKGEKIAALTAYDASFSAVMSTAGVDLLLVGDTLGCVFQGHTTTLPVSLEDIVYHTRAVLRAQPTALIVADLPFATYTEVRDAIAAAATLMQAGAHMVKLEGGAWVKAIVTRLTELGIPVCCHLGLTPQYLHTLGGYKYQGKCDAAADQLLTDAEILVEAGAKCLVLECVPSALAKRITQTLALPTIGIGAGQHTDGQILVTYDLLGLSINGAPSFARNFLAEHHSIQAAITQYVRAVKAGTFPDNDHTLF